MKRTLSSSLGVDESETTYSHGLFKVPSNCRIMKIDVEGQKDLSNVRVEDRMTISNVIKTASNFITQSNSISKECGVIITCAKQVVDNITLLDYVVLLQFHIDTVFEAQHFAMIQHVNPIRCGSGDSIKTFPDIQKNKHCMMITVSSVNNPVQLKETVLIYQHFSTLLYTSDDDETSSKNPLKEESINRKRAKKGDILYSKVCVNK